MDQYDPKAFDFAARALEEINLASVPGWELIRPIIAMRNLAKGESSAPRHS